MTGYRLAILNKLQDSLDFLDLPERRFVGRVEMPAHPHELTLSRNGQTLYASIYGDGVYGNNVHPGHEVFLIDVAAMHTRAVIDLAPHRGPHAMAEDPAGNLWVTCDDSGEVLVVDPRSAHVETVIDMDCHGGHFMAMTSDGSIAYVSNKDNAHLSVIDCASRELIDRIGLSDGCEGLCLSPDEDTVYVVSHMGSPLPNPGRPLVPSLYVIDARRQTLVQEVPLDTLPELAPGTDTESRVTVTPDGRLILVSAFSWNSLVILDAATLAIRKTLIVDAEPMNFAYHPDDPDGAYLTNHRAGVISRLSLSTLEITDRMPSSPSQFGGRPEHLMFVHRS